MKLKEIRESRGISQRQAAIALNLSPTVYNRYENGLREPSNSDSEGHAFESHRAYQEKP